MTRAAWWIVIAAAITALLVGWYVLAGGLSYKPTGVSRSGPSRGVPGRKLADRAGRVHPDMVDLA